MYKIDSKLVNRDSFLPGVHGLRGFAAIAVVFFHLVHIGGIPLPNYLKFISRDFGYCVHLFFVLSAYSLMHSTLTTTNNKNWILTYFTKRFLRIAPLFYTLIIFEIIRQVWWSGIISTSLTQILLNITFTFGTIPFSGIVWGGWSIGVEMIFYFLFPMLLMLISSLRTALVVMLLGVAVSYLTRYTLQLQYINLETKPPYDWSYFAFMPNLAFFLIGIFAFFLVKHIKSSTYKWLNLIVPATLTLLLILLCGAGKLLPTLGGISILIWGVAFLGLTTWQSITPSWWTDNRIMVFFGERSFSVYLIHPIVITFWKTFLPSSVAWITTLPDLSAFVISSIVILLTVLAISEITYRYVEVPGIKLSRYFVKKLNIVE